MTDIIDHLTGAVPGSRADVLRARRPVTRESAQDSHEALFEPVDVSEVSLAERLAVATFVASLHGQPEIARLYSDRLATEKDGGELLAATAVAARAGAAIGPYGDYPEGPLSVENLAGPVFAVAESERKVLGERLSAALEHAHLLVFRLRDASPEALDKLLAAGWSTTGIVTLSQLVSFLAFQIRVVAGLKVLSAA